METEAKSQDRSSDAQTEARPYASLLTPKSYVHRGVADVERAAKEAVGRLLYARELEEGLYGLVFHAYLRSALKRLLTEIMEEVVQIEEADCLQEYLVEILPLEARRIHGEYVEFASSVEEKCKTLGWTGAEAEQRLCQVFQLQSNEERALLTGMMKDAAKAAAGRQEEGEPCRDTFTPAGAVKRRPTSVAEECHLPPSAKRVRMMNVH